MIQPRSALIAPGAQLIATELPTGLDEREKAELAEELAAPQEAIGEFLAKLETM